jgi:hypothetical protein
MRRIKIWLYSLWYGIKFEKGYIYKRVKSCGLDYLEAYHTMLIGQGWMQITEVNAGFNKAWVWYRKLTQPNTFVF